MKELVVVEKGGMVIDAYDMGELLDIEIENVSDYGEHVISLDKKEVKKLIKGLEKFVNKPSQMKTLDGFTIFTDGGHSMKSGKGGWAFIVVYKGEIIMEEFGRVKGTTNNVMEMTAFIKACGYIEKVNLIGTDSVKIISDSQYIVKGFNSWMLNWAKSEWKGTNGDVKNKELWEKIYSFKDLDITVEWVKAHNKKSGTVESYYNDIVDKLTKN